MFERIEKLPPDPILGLSAAFNRDASPDKIDLGAGVYKDESGNTPVFAAVKQAEQRWQSQEDTKVYTPQPGFADFNSQLIRFVFGETHPAVAAERICSVMAPGGSGSLRVGAELVNRCRPKTTLWVSQPTWGNHIPLLGTTGLQIQEYPYYDSDSHGISFAATLETLANAGPDDVVLLHGCCHNPTGADFNKEQWQEIAALAQDRGFLPFIDTAYHGLGDGLEADVHGVRLLAETVPELLLAYSCSKNFGLYRERTGSIVVLGKDRGAAGVAASHLTNIARTMYSLPPAHGAAIVKEILADATLYQRWEQELSLMRTRINDLRALLADTLATKKAPADFAFIKTQKGMFSFLGISKEQVQRLRNEYSIYIVGSSRINVAAVNRKNIDYLTDAIISVM